jgi:hypothetical protein
MLVHHTIAGFGQSCLYRYTLIAILDFILTRGFRRSQFLVEAEKLEVSTRLPAKQVLVDALYHVDEFWSPVLIDRESSIEYFCRTQFFLVGASQVTLRLFESWSRIQLLALFPSDYSDIRP